MPAHRKSRLLLIPPPALYLLAFVVGLAIDRAVPWRPLWMHSSGWIGWLLIALGLVLGPMSAALFLLRRTTLIPTARPSTLVTTGAYRISRNPMYLGLALIYCGLAIVLGYAWPLIALPIPLLVMSRVVIPAEEAHLQQVFGDAFSRYCQRVRRWL